MNNKPKTSDDNGSLETIGESDDNVGFELIDKNQCEKEEIKEIYRHLLEYSNPDKIKETIEIDNNTENILTNINGQLGMYKLTIWEDTKPNVSHIEISNIFGEFQIFIQTYLEIHNTATKQIEAYKNNNKLISILQKVKNDSRMVASFAIKATSEELIQLYKTNYNEKEYQNEKINILDNLKKIKNMEAKDLDNYLNDNTFVDTVFQIYSMLIHEIYRKNFETNNTIEHKDKTNLNSLISELENISKSENGEKEIGTQDFEKLKTKLIASIYQNLKTIKTDLVDKIEDKKSKFGLITSLYDVCNGCNKPNSKIEKDIGRVLIQVNKAKAVTETVDSNYTTEPTEEKITEGQGSYTTDQIKIFSETFSKIQHIAIEKIAKHEGVAIIIQEKIEDEGKVIFEFAHRSIQSKLKQKYKNIEYLDIAINQPESFNLEQIKDKQTQDFNNFISDPIDIDTLFQLNIIFTYAIDNEKEFKLNDLNLAQLRNNLENAKKELKIKIIENLETKWLGYLDGKEEKDYQSFDALQLNDLYTYCNQSKYNAIPHMQEIATQIEKFNRDKKYSKEKGAYTELLLDNTVSREENRLAWLENQRKTSSHNSNPLKEGTIPKPNNKSVPSTEEESESTSSSDKKNTPNQPPSQESIIQKFMNAVNYLCKIIVDVFWKIIDKMKNVFGCGNKISGPSATNLDDSKKISSQDIGSY